MYNILSLCLDRHDSVITTCDSDYIGETTLGVNQPHSDITVHTVHKTNQTGPHAEYAQW